MDKQFCDHFFGRGSILVLCGFIIVILFCDMACIGGKTPAVSAVLSDLEIIRRDSVLWSRAGITESFIPSADRKHTDTLRAVANMQKQLNSLSERGGGRLVVPPGRFEITRTVMIPSDVAIVGVDRDASIFEINMKETFENSGRVEMPGSGAAAFLFYQSRNASLENLTIRYVAADFEPFDFDDYNHDWVRAVFHEHDPRTDSLFVVSVWFQEAENCLLTKCTILQSGTDPVRIRFSQHITCSYNFIDRAYNKGGGGAGYYNISNSHHCLVYKETVRRIRHLAIQNNSSYNVVYGCDLQTDVNFHNGDSGHNLVENNDILIPVWHSWRPFSFGVPGQHQPPGPYNVIFRNRTDYKNSGPQVDKEALYFLADFFPDSEQGESRFIATPYAENFPDGVYNQTYKE